MSTRTIEEPPASCHWQLTTATDNRLTLTLRPNSLQFFPAAIKLANIFPDGS